MTGSGVDPRYTLANERTFLAWIRTALGLLAAAAGLLAIDLSWPEWAVQAIASLLAVVAGIRLPCVDPLAARGGGHRACSCSAESRAHVLLALTVVAVAGAVVVLALL